MSTPQYSETVTKMVYAFLGMGCLVAMITNVTKHGFNLSGVIWPLLLAGTMFSLGMQPQSAPRDSGKWTTLYFGSLSLVLYLFGTIIYQRFFQ